MKHFRPSSVGSATRSLFCGFVWYLLFFAFSLFSLRVPVRWALYVLIVSFFSLLCCSVRLFVSVNLVYLCFHLFPLVFLFLFVLAMFFGLFRLSRRLFCLLSVSSFFFSPPCLFGRAWSFLFYLFMLWVSVTLSLSFLFFLARVSFYWVCSWVALFVARVRVFYVFILSFPAFFLPLFPLLPVLRGPFCLTVCLLFLLLSRSCFLPSSPRPLCSRFLISPFVSVRLHSSPGYSYWLRR